MNKIQNKIHENVNEWRLLYRVSAIAALLTALFIPLQAILFIVWPPPLQGTILEWFSLFQKSWFIGLLSLDLLLLIDYILLIPIILSLYVLLKNSNKPLMLLGVTLFFIAIAAYFSSNTAFEMLALSNQYAGASTQAEKQVLLTAGQTMISTYTGTAFHTSYILGQLAGIIVSFVMLKSGIFSKTTAYAGILGNAIGYGLYIPVIGIYISLFSVIGLWIWYILIAKKLFQIK